MRREALLLPALVLYLATLVLAAWPAEVRPAFLDPASRGAYDVLEAMGLRAGIPVFQGTLEQSPSIVRARCVLVRGRDAGGVLRHLHPTSPCPAQGLRWEPVVYDHMILHWSLMILEERNRWNALAMADHFCVRARHLEIRRVEMFAFLHLMDYETGQVSVSRAHLGDVACRS